MEVIPISLVDQHRPVPNIRTRTFFVVDDVLDEGVLRSALDRLIRDHWRKLGARIVPRKDTKGRFFEYHLPKVFPDGYELFKWSSKEYGQSFDKFKAKMTPTADMQQKGVGFLSSIHDIDSWFRPADVPYHVSDDPPNAPMLYVHMSFFADATVILLSMPHMLGDQMGKASLVRAWLALVEGREPPAMYGYNEDVVPGHIPRDQIPKEELYRKGKLHVRKPLEYLFCVMGFMPELVFHPKETA
ncbi:hypothetical protein MMYC01_201523, partial [Madurella mycetomatis]